MQSRFISSVTKSATCFLVSLLLWSPISKADSPATSTYFADVYKKVKQVRIAAETSTMTKKLARYLFSNRSNMGEKAAVINALGWSQAGMSNTIFLQQAVAKRHRISTFEEIPISEITGIEAMCIGYMMLLDDYFNPIPSIPYLEHAAMKYPTSFTVNMLLTIARCQVAMLENEWCKVWTITAAFIAQKSLQMDIKAEAWQAVKSYLVIYESECR